MAERRTVQQRSNLILFGAVAFFLIGGWLVYLIVDSEISGGDECWSRGGVPALAPDQKSIVCIDPSALR